MTSCPVCGNPGAYVGGVFVGCVSASCRSEAERPEASVPVESSPETPPFPAMKPDARQTWSNYHHDFGDI